MNDESQRCSSIDDCLEVKGFWSKKYVYVNNTKKIALLTPIPMYGLVDYIAEKSYIACKRYINESAAHVVSNFSENGKLNMDIWKARSLLSDTFRIEFRKRKGIVRYSDLETQYKNKPNTIRKIFMDAYTSHLETRNYQQILGTGVNSSYDDPVGVCILNTRFIQDNFATVDEFLTLSLDLISSRVSKGYKLENGYCVSSHYLFKHREIISPEFWPKGNLTKAGMKYKVKQFLSILAWLLLYLVKDGYILLPSGHVNIKPSKRLFDPDWQTSLCDYFSLDHEHERRLLYRLFQTSTARRMEDLSVELCMEYNSSALKLPGAGLINFIPPINRFHDAQPKLEKFPIGLINRKRTIIDKSEAETKRLPQYYYSRGMYEWGVSVETYYKSIEGSVQTKRSSVAAYINWAVDLGFESPWKIKPSDLINPLNLDDDATLYAHLKKECKSENSMSQKWASSKRFCDIVTNALKPNPEFDNYNIHNPFEGLINPFKQKSRGGSLSKSHRPPIPEEHLEKMTDVLLCIENSEPTFKYAKTLFTQDWAERKNHKTGNFEVVWHPARVICLAILLLIPIRGKQARWLDQGLLDSHKWDVGSNSWIENEHQLTQYQYANTKTHMETYGRLSGVLQPLTTIFNQKGEQLGLFINTNKTKLWDSQDKSGYEIPWPDGREFEQSDDPTIKAKGKRLGLIYKLLEIQIQWMETYDPEPVPVNYIDDGEKYDPAIEHLMPVFTPIFRDLTSPITTSDGKTACIPVSKTKIERLFTEIAIEAERQFMEQGYTQEQIGLTKHSNKYASKRKCTYDIHTLRVTGITNLLEMGVPAHIVSEYIAGHASLVMTLYYAKFRPTTLRQSILDAFTEKHKLENTVAELVNRNTTELSNLLVQSKQFENIEGATPALRQITILKGVWRYFNGGICPGASCSDGGIFKNDSATSKGGYSAGMVVGGKGACGNCRHFVTGPSFLIPQMLIANNIMLEMRELGRKRKDLWDRRAQLEVETESHPEKAMYNHSELSLISGELENIDLKLEPLILEWCNRLELMQRSKAIATKTRNPNELVFVGSNESEIESDIKADGCDFSLVRQIVTQSEIVGDRHIRSELAEHKLREFVDKILLNHDIKSLMMQISDKSLKRKASILMAEAITFLAGGDNEAQSLADNGGLLTDGKNTLNELASLVCNERDNNEIMELLNDAV